MAKRRRIFTPKPFRATERPLAAFQHEAGIGPYCPVSSLQEAKQYEDGIVIQQGDDGGQIYVVARAIGVKCSIETLQQLLIDLDEIAWPDNDASMRRIFFERRSIGSPIAGGMGGGMVLERPWVHKNFSNSEPAILAVLGGTRARIR